MKFLPHTMAVGFITGLDRMLFCYTQEYLIHMTVVRIIEGGKGKTHI